MGLCSAALWAAKELRYKLENIGPFFFKVGPCDVAPFRVLKLAQKRYYVHVQVTWFWTKPIVSP